MLIPFTGFVSVLLFTFVVSVVYVIRFKRSFVLRQIITLFATLLAFRTVLYMLFVVHKTALYFVAL